MISSVYVVRRSYVMLTHELRINNVNIENQQTTIKKLKKQNKQLHFKFEITKIAWIKKTYVEFKIHSLLIVKIATMTSTNRFIKKNILQNYFHKICEYFDKNCRLKRCFNCQQYDHTETMCKNIRKCVKCAQKHNNQFYKTQNDQRKYAICEK